jgi:hypothetical protein
MSCVWWKISHKSEASLGGRALTNNEEASGGVNALIGSTMSERILSIERGLISLTDYGILTSLC